MTASVLTDGVGRQQPHPGAQPQQRRRYHATTLASVEPEQVRWLWADRLPRGKLVTIDGDPDIGKSTLALDLAARITTGRPLPGDTVALVPPSSVVLLAAEDGLADTIRPRLDAAGADPARVHHLDRVPHTRTIDDKPVTRWEPPTIPDDLAALESLITDTGAVLVIIDVLMAYLSDRTNSHRDQDVRRALTHLAEIAERTDATVILLRHLRKSGGSAMYAGGGSIGIIGVARAGMLAHTDPDDKIGKRRILARIKGNLGPPWRSLTYRLVDTGTGVASVDWIGESEHTADTLLAFTADGDRSAVDMAADWLAEVLADGPQRYTEIERMARAEGISRSTLHRARDRLVNVEITRDKTTVGRPSTWTLTTSHRTMERNPRNETPDLPDQGKLAEPACFVPGQGAGTKPLCRACGTPCRTADEDGPIHPNCAPHPIRCRLLDATPS